MQTYLINLLSLSCGLLLYAFALAAYHQAAPRALMKSIGFALALAVLLSLFTIQL